MTLKAMLVYIKIRASFKIIIGINLFLPVVASIGKIMKALGKSLNEDLIETHKYLWTFKLFSKHKDTYKCKVPMHDTPTLLHARNQLLRAK